MLQDIIKELNKIADTEGDESEVGWRKRRNMVLEFVNNRLCSINTQLHVINPNSFSTAMMDLAKEKLCEKIAEDLTSETQYDIVDNKIKAEMLIVRKKRKN